MLLTNFNFYKFIKSNFLKLKVAESKISSHWKSHLNEYLYQFFIFSFIGLLFIFVGYCKIIGEFIYNITLPNSQNYVESMLIIKEKLNKSVNYSFMTESENDSGN